MQLACSCPGAAACEAVANRARLTISVYISALLICNPPEVEVRALHSTVQGPLFWASAPFKQLRVTAPDGPATGQPETVHIPCVTFHSRSSRRRCRCRPRSETVRETEEVRAAAGAADWYAAGGGLLSGSDGFTLGCTECDRSRRGTECQLASAPVTENHLSSDPERMKMIGATHWLGRPRNASMSESPELVAGKPPVVMLTVPTFPFPP